MDPLSAVLEESATFPSTSSLYAQEQHQEESHADEPVDLEPVPTLSSLLLSTAESLSSRTTTPTPSAPLIPHLPPNFTLHHSPSLLLSDPTSTAYLSTLLSLPLPSLLSLPSSLSSLAQTLDTDLSSLAFARYSSFLLSHSATQQISLSFSSLSSTLSQLIQATSELEDASNEFEKSVEGILKKRGRMKRVRERVEDVEELLEASNIVEQCVRAGFWSEAIDVALRLAELHSRLVNAPRETEGGEGGEGDGEAKGGVGALVLLQRVRDQISLALLSLRARVLDSLLQRSLKLPGAVRGIGILRRINGGGLGLDEGGGGEMNDEAMRIVFLAARWRCLRGELEGVEAQMVASGIKLAKSSGGANGTTEGNGTGRPRAGSKGKGGKEGKETSSSSSIREEEATIGLEENEERTRWAKRWIEVWREVVGETVGMYTEVFLSSTITAPSMSPNPSTSSDSPSTPTHNHLSPSAPLALFLSSSLDSLSETLLASLPSLTSTSSLASLLTQLAYCSHSFARHGLEFREFENIRENVEDRVAAIVVSEWETAGLKWEMEWRAGWEGGVRRRGKERKPIHSWLVVAEGLSTVMSTPAPPPPTSTSTTTWHHQPSPTLALLPPLARLLNAHATALNSLRLLPSIALYQTLNRTQLRQLDRAAQVLGAFVDAWLASVDALPSSRQGQALEQEELSEEEKIILEEKREERELIGFAIKCFGRSLVVWCEGALREGVYKELEEGVPEVIEAVVRAERLIAKLEGKEEVSMVPVPVPPPSSTTTTTATATTTNGTSPPPPPTSSPPVAPDVTNTNGAGPPLASETSSIISVASSTLSNGNGNGNGNGTSNGAMEPIDDSSPLTVRQGTEEEETEAVVLPEVVGQEIEVIGPEATSTVKVAKIVPASVMEDDLVET